VKSKVDRTAVTDVSDSSLFGKYFQTLFSSHYLGKVISTRPALPLSLVASLNGISKQSLTMVQITGKLCICQSPLLTLNACLRSFLVKYEVTNKI